MKVTIRPADLEGISADELRLAASYLYCAGDMRLADLPSTRTEVLRLNTLRAKLRLWADMLEASETTDRAHRATAKRTGEPADETDDLGPGE
jgi:hypothetical protein